MSKELDEFISKVLSIDRIERCKNIPLLGEEYLTEDNIRYILLKLESIKITWVQENTVIRRFPQLFDFLTNWSNNTFSTTLPFSECYYLFTNKINTIPTCKCCDKKTIFKSKTAGYTIYCSNVCSSSDEDIIKKIKDTFISRGSIRKKRKKSENPRSPNKELVRIFTDKPIIYNSNIIKEIIDNNHYSIFGERSFKKRYPIHYQNVINWSFLYNKNTLDFKEILYLFINNITGKESQCSFCSKKTSYVSYTEGYNKYCSVKCSSNSQENINKRKSTFFKKYGSENPFAFGSQLQKERNMELFGVDNVSKLPEIKLKKENTTLKNYNTRYYTQTEQGKENLSHKISRPEHRAAIIEGLHNKYGATNPSYIQHIVDKRQTIYKENFISTISEWCGNNNYTYIDGGFQCEDYNMLCPYNHNFKINWQLFYLRSRDNRTICTVCNPVTKNRSYAEIELFDFIKENYEGEIIPSDRSVLDGKELDIFLPDLYLAFEYNGLYWHSEDRKDKYYHRNKTLACHEKNIRLIHIFEDDWLYKKDIIKNMISDLLYTSPSSNDIDKLWVTEISINKEKEFLENNHLLGHCPSSNCIGLLDDNGTIISLISFLTSDINIEILRHKTLVGYDNISCFTKLLGHLDKDKEIIIYSDMNWGIDSFYELSGFTLKGLSEEVNEYRILDGIRITYNKEYLTEDKSHRIHDCGQILFQYLIINQLFPLFHQH